MIFTTRSSEMETQPTHDSPEHLTLRILKELVGPAPLSRLRIRLWDGSYSPDGASASASATLLLKHPGSLRAMLLGGSEVALAEAYLRDDFDVDGNLEAAFELGDRILDQTDGWSKKLKLAYLLKQLPDRTHQEPTAMRQANLQGSPHSTMRDQAAIEFHYDLSNDFYGLWLDSRRVYSCGYFRDERDSLENAQRQKLDLICRKLGLQPGQRLLDVGCGWGGLILHAASHFGVHATGVTLSKNQAEYARQRIGELGLEDRVQVRIEDYRNVEGEERFDAVVSVGMVEHVGRKRLPEYFGAVHRLLKPGGVFLNHGIGTGVVPARNHGESFSEKYVFPDGDLYPIAEMLQPAEAAGFEIRDVENLREHYMLTLRQWVRRLEQQHEAALKFVSEPVYRIWRVYMSGAAHSFDTAQLAVYQTLLAKLDAKGRAACPPTREGWYLPSGKNGA